MITLDRLDNELANADREILSGQIARVRDEIKKQRSGSTPDFVAEIDDLVLTANYMISDLRYTSLPLDRIVKRHGFEASEIIEAITTKYIERLAFGW